MWNSGTHFILDRTVQGKRLSSRTIIELLATVKTPNLDWLEENCTGRYRRTPLLSDAGVGGPAGIYYDRLRIEFDRKEDATLFKLFFA